MNCTLLLIRHGTTAWNQQARYQGHGDPPLNRSGRAQARRLARAMGGLRLDAVYSSDLRRAMATAAPLAQARGLPVQVEPRLRELNFGAWDGCPAEEVTAADPDFWQAWRADPVTLAPPGGETLRELWDRVAAALADIYRRHPAGTVAVVTHGGPLRTVLAGLAGDALQLLPAVSVPNAGWLLVTPTAGAAIQKR